MAKTNAQRLLETQGISYELKEYEWDESDLSGTHVAAQLNEDPAQVFKTLVCHDSKGGHYVFCIPVDQELDLKKAAKAAGVKQVHMLPVKELVQKTGYMRGGCSPLAMKKVFPTYVDETAQLYDWIAVSAGVRGAQLLLNAEDLAQVLELSFVDLVH